MYSVCYLIESILDDNQHRGVQFAEFPVEGLEAGAMTGRTVSQVPAGAHCPRGELLTQLRDIQRGRRFLINKGGGGRSFNMNRARY